MGCILGRKHKENDYSFDDIGDAPNGLYEGVPAPSPVKLPMYKGTIRLGPVMLPPPKEAKLGFKVAVAIDFGTTLTGYAYSYIDDPYEISMNKNWGSATSHASFKTPTCVCFDELEKFVGFGHEAQTVYLDDEQDDNSKQLYQRFKMQLHSKRQETSADLKIESDYGKEINGLKVFAEALKYLKGHFLEVSMNAARISSADEVLWVLTVPAIWSDRDKLFMKKAAVEAGLVDSTSSNKLIIALEPEAASFFCRTLDLRSKLNKLQPGNKYMIIDAGGGTVDITVHQINTDGSTREIHPPSGGPWGGDVVNQGFEKLLKQVLGADFLNYCKSENPCAWFEFMTEFERAKVGYKDFSKPMSLKIYLQFSDCYKEKMGTSLSAALANTKDKGIWASKHTGNLQVGSSHLKEIFDPPIKNITDHIHELLKSVTGIDAMFVVGGFGSCSRLFSSIRDAFNKDYIVIQPEDPMLCVVKGAVLFAHRPDFITSRISPRTYSILAYKDIPTTGKDERRIEGDHYKYLEPIIHKGDPIEINTTITKYGVPTEDHLTTVEIELYSASDKFDENPLSESNVKVGKVVVQCNRQLADRTITIDFIFGGTSITVKGANSDDQSEEAVINFD